MVSPTVAWLEKDGHEYDDRLKIGIKRFDELLDDDIDPTLADRVWFPEEMYLDRSGEKWYQRIRK